MFYSALTIIRLSWLGPISAFPCSSKALLVMIGLSQLVLPLSPSLWDLLFLGLWSTPTGRYTLPESLYPGPVNTRLLFGALSFFSPLLTI